MCAVHQPGHMQPGSRGYQQWLAGWSDATAQRLESALQRTMPLVQQVIAQAERRVLHGESVPASAKLVSLFEPHTAIVRRGKAHLPAEFGRKVVLDEVDGGLVTRYVVFWWATHPTRRNYRTA